MQCSTLLVNKVFGAPIFESEAIREDLKFK